MRPLTIILLEVLGRSAEITMHQLVRTVFRRLHSLDPIAEEQRLLGSDESTSEGELKMSVSPAISRDLAAPVGIESEESVATTATEETMTQENISSSDTATLPPVPAERPQCEPT